MRKIRVIFLIVALVIAIAIVVAWFQQPTSKEQRDKKEKVEITKMLNKAKRMLGKWEKKKNRLKREQEEIEARLKVRREVLSGKRIVARAQNMGNSRDIVRKLEALFIGGDNSRLKTIGVGLKECDENIEALKVAIELFKRALGND